MGSSTVHFLVAAVACLTADSSEDKGQMSLKDAAIMLSSKKNKASLTKKFSMQLVDLVSNIRSGELHFIRCIKPNHLLAPANFDGNFINTQLRYSGMMAAVDVRRHGFPVRMPIKEFQHQFQPLAHSSQSSSCHTLVSAFGFSQEDCQVGSSMVFMKDGVFHSLRARLLVIQAQRLVTIQCCFRCAQARRCCKRRRWATRFLQSRCRSAVAYASTKRKLVTLYLNDAVIACDEAQLVRYLSMAQEEQDGVAPARRKLQRIAETREFIQGLKQCAAVMALLLTRLFVT
jgi:myosin heavy subunit